MVRGQPAVYTPEVLKRIAANGNRWIGGIGNWAVVCLGHTDAQAGPKPLVGFAGPFRVSRAPDGRALRLLLASYPEPKLYKS